MKKDKNGSAIDAIKAAREEIRQIKKLHTHVINTIKAII